MKHQNNKKNSQEIDIVFIANFVPSIGDGASTYILSMLEYLSNNNCNIHYISTGVSIQSWMKLFMLPSIVQQILLRSLYRYCQFIFSRPVLLKEYFKTLVFFLYSSLPIPIKRSYRNIKKIILKSLNIDVKDDSDINPNMIKINPTLYQIVQKETLPYAKQEIQRISPHIVIANYVWMAYALDFAHADALKVIVTHDIMHERFESFKNLDLPNAEPQLLFWDQQTEVDTLSKADLLLAIQEDEAKTLCQLVTNTEVLTIPIAVNLQPTISRQIRGRCLFVGSQAKHNFYSLEWFLKEVWQKLLEDIPYAELNVCGSVGTWFDDDFPNVYFKGIVPDLSVEYSQAQVCIIPSLVGSGLKIKLIEALSFGKACVSTSIGLQGLSNIGDEVVILADDKDSFYLAVQDLIVNDQKRENIECLAKNFVVNSLSPNVVYKPLINRFRQHITEV